MRIGYECFLTGPHETGVGGAVRELLKALLDAREDMNVVVYASPKSRHDLPQRPCVQYQTSRMAGISRASRIMWQQFLAPRATAGRVDVYHATGYAMSAFRFPVPTVLSIYDTTAIEHSHLARWTNTCHFRWTVPHGARTATRIIVPSQYVATRLNKLFDIGCERVRVVPLGVASDFCVGKGVQYPKGLPSPYVLFVGNLERKKNVPLLVRVLAELRKRGRNLVLLLAGSHGNAARGIAALANKEGVRNVIQFAGYINRADLVKLYQGAVMLLYPSLDEGFGLPPLEAMACGTPVVASNRGAIPEVTGGAALLLEPTDVRAWVDAIDALITDPSLSRQFRDKGLRRASEFTWRRTARQVIDVYEESVFGK